MSESKFVIKFSNVNRNKYVYYPPVTTKSGIVECRCEYKQDSNKTVPFFFESPRLIAATGIISLDNKFYIDLVVPMSSPFLDWLLAEDEKNIAVTADNSEDWLGERTSVEEISQGYKTSLVFRSQDKDPILRVNIPNNRGKPGIEVFDNNKKLTTISEVVPGVEVACIMEKQPLRFYRDKFTGEYLIYKLKVCSTAHVVKLPPGYIFGEQSGGESEGEADNRVEQEEDEQSVEEDEERSESEDPLAVSGDESEEEDDPLAVSGDESEEEDDPLAVSGDESEEEDDPLAVSGDESEEEDEQSEEDPLAVSGDEEQSEEEDEDPLAVSGDESEEDEERGESEERSDAEDPLAVSGDESEEEQNPYAFTDGESEEEEDPLAVSGDESEEDEDPLAVSGDESEEDPLAVSGDESEPESVNLDNYPDSEFSLGEGGEDEEISESKPRGSKFLSSELTESDLDLSEFEA